MDVFVYDNPYTTLDSISFKSSSVETMLVDKSVGNTNNSADNRVYDISQYHVL